jgi:hypothetical protein
VFLKWEWERVGVGEGNEAISEKKSETTGERKNAIKK